MNLKLTSSIKALKRKKKTKTKTTKALLFPSDLSLSATSCVIEILGRIQVRDQPVHAPRSRNSGPLADGRPWDQQRTTSIHGKTPSDGDVGLRSEGGWVRTTPKTEPQIT